MPGHIHRKQRARVTEQSEEGKRGGRSPVSHAPVAGEGQSLAVTWVSGQNKHNQKVCFKGEFT